MKLAPSVFNRQRKMPFRTAPLRKFLPEAANLAGAGFPFSVILVSDRSMSSLNQRFAGKRSPTDVLSFPTSSEDRQADPYLGDVFISLETADRQRTGSLEDEVKLLALHGLLHLLGFDHEVDHGEMEELEGRLRTELGLK